MNSDLTPGSSDPFLYHPHQSFPPPLHHGSKSSHEGVGGIDNDAMTLDGRGEGGLSDGDGDEDDMRSLSSTNWNQNTGGGRGKGSQKENEDERKKRRLEKNREIARNCRARKRERMTVLEEEVTKLKEENEKLRVDLHSLMSNDVREDKRRLQITSIKKHLEEGEKDHLNGELSSYIDTYADFGKERKMQVKHHLEQLKMLLLPNTVTKMSLWTLHQEDDFYNEKVNFSVNGGGIWNMLCDAMSLTNEQKLGILSCRNDVKMQRKNLAASITALHELEDRVNSNFSTAGSTLGKIMGLLTSEQQAKFLLWIEHNQACMHMLNNLWRLHDPIHDDVGASTTTTPNPSTTSSVTGNGNHDDQAINEGVTLSSAVNNTPLVPAPVLGGMREVGSDN